MEKFTQKQLRSFGNEEVFWKRLKDYQAQNNTTGLPSAYELGYEAVGYSSGLYGCNGSLFKDKETNELIGVVGYNSNIYIR